MHKIILILSICALIPAVYVATAVADNNEVVEDIVSDRGVAKRVNCDDIKSEMDKLNAIAELDEGQVATLNGLKSDWRSKCMKQANARTRGRTKVVVTEVVKTDSGENVASVADVSDAPKNPNNVSVSCDNPDANGCCPGENYTDLGDLGFNCCTENNEKCFPPIVMEKDFSLCDDGTNPDNDGCCAGETYTDLGDLGFNCCQADGVTCFPPIKR